MGKLKLSRRQFLGLGAAGAGGLLLQYGLSAGWGGSAAEHNHAMHAPGLIFREAGVSRSRLASPTVARFQIPLPIPQVRRPDRSDSSGDYYTVRAQVGRQQILPGLTTTVWGYDGIFPSHTFDIQRGRRTFVRVINELPEPISCHYHGGVTAPEHDGYAEDIVLNGVKLPTLIQPAGNALGRPNEWTYEYPNEQAACTNWFHDHAIHHTAEHVYRGTAAFYLVRDAEEASFNLPQGQYEIPLVFQDRAFDSSGEMLYSTDDHDGLEGDIMLVNGAPWPRVQVAARKYRLRMLNGSNKRRYDLSFSNKMPFAQIGTESGFLRAPQSLPMLRMYPAERHDVVVDFSKVPVGTTIYLLNKEKDARGTTMDRVMAFEVVRRESDDSRVPATLTQYPDLTTASAISAAVRTRSFKLDRSNGYYTINSKIWDPKRFDANPRLGTTEIWRIYNSSGGWFHPLHIHLVNFQIIDRVVSGVRVKPNAWERGRKDVVQVPENEEVRIIINFDPHEYLNFTGPYMMHCHNVNHEDHDMMTQFQVLPQA